MGLATIIANNCELNANFSNFGAYNITIPSYAKTATIKVCGAKGGGGNGGNGGCVSGSFAIVGDKINNSTALGIYVGNSITGYNGGGWGNHAYTDSYPGSAIYGGGSTDVRTSSDIANRIIVGGGGGGSAGDGNYLGGSGGGGNAGSNSLGTGYGGGGGLGYSGGGYIGGSNGGGEVVCFHCGGGSGGGLNGGGARSCNNWTYNICAGNGSSGNGGNGSTSAWWATHYCTTAGGGGGYYGGGGSSTGRCGGGGGGGGSSFIYNGSTNQVFNGGAHNSNIGYAEIKFKK